MLIYRESITLLGIVLLIYEISFKNTIKMAEKSKTNKYPIILTEKLDSYKYRQKIKMLLIKKMKITSNVHYNIDKKIHPDIELKTEKTIVLSIFLYITVNLY